MATCSTTMATYGTPTARGKGQQGVRQHDNADRRHDDGKGQQGDMRHDDGDGRHDDGKGQQGDRRHEAARR
jgi:hypothetical protein